MSDPISLWDHVIPAGRAEFEGLSWTKLSRIFGEDFGAYILVVYGVVVTDEAGWITGVYHERDGTRLWVLAHGVAALDERLYSTPTSKFGDAQLQNFERFREMVYVALGTAHPLGLLEILSVDAAFSGSRATLKAAIDWFIGRPAWERWYAAYQESRLSAAHLFGGRAA
jgi:hypothetical protein